MVIFLITGFVAAQTLAVTDVQVQGDSAEVTINNIVVIKEIEVKKVGGGIKLRYPTYVSRTGREYPQVRVSQVLQKVIENAIQTGKPQGTPTKDITYKITKFDKFRRQSSLKYFCAVSINNQLEIECKVIDSPRGQGPFISWPSRKDEETGKWVNQVVIINRDLKKAIEDELLSRYKKAKTEATEEEEY
ncbi:MAG: SpoVG family protein [bacterium]|nr:SpoVG family protein [bacterium]